MASLNCFLHPHHVTLMDHPHTFQSFRHHFDDPYYRHESHHSHRGLISPHFDVFGTEAAYFLNGEMPGVADKKQISIAWLASQTLVVRGWMKPIDNEAEWNTSPLADGTIPVPKETSSKESVTIESNMPLAGQGMQQTNGHDTNGKRASDDDRVNEEPKCWLRERAGGQFERSFTFPSGVNPDGVRARLEYGVLKMMVPRIAGTVEGTKLIPID